MWKKLSSEIIFKHPRLTLVEDQVRLPNGEVVPYLRFQEQQRNVTILCIKGNELLLQKQYSYPPNKVLFEFPGGGVNDSESLEEAAERELKEEAGLWCNSLQASGWFYLNNRRSYAKMHVFIARDPVNILKNGGDAEESTGHQWVSIKGFEEMIDNGQIVNYSMLAAWSLVRSKI